MTILRVAVGSTNPCKIEAVREAFSVVFEKQLNNVEVVITPCHSESGVSDQPFGDEETKRGAYNRANEALSSGNGGEGNNYQQAIDFAVGLEGGLERTIHPQTNEDELYCMAWMAILGKKKLFSTGDQSAYYCSYAKTASFLLPPKICQLVLDQNMELGHADDQVFDRTNSKHGSGTVGVLTKGEIDRKGYYVHALKLGLIPWVMNELYLSDD